MARAARLCAVAAVAALAATAAASPFVDSGPLRSRLLASNDSQANMTEQGNSLRTRGRQVQLFYSGMPRRDYLGQVVPPGLCSNPDFDPLRPSANGGCDMNYFMGLVMFTAPGIVASVLCVLWMIFFIGFRYCRCCCQQGYPVEIDGEIRDELRVYGGCGGNRPSRGVCCCYRRDLFWLQKAEGQALGYTDQTRYSWLLFFSILMIGEFTILGYAVLNFSGFNLGIDGFTDGFLKVGADTLQDIVGIRDDLVALDAFKATDRTGQYPAGNSELITAQLSKTVDLGELLVKQSGVLKTFWDEKPLPTVDLSYKQWRLTLFMGVTLFPFVLLMLGGLGFPVRCCHRCSLCSGWSSALALILLLVFFSLLFPITVMLADFCHMLTTAQDPDLTVMREITTITSQVEQVEKVETDDKDESVASDGARTTLKAVITSVVTKNITKTVVANGTKANKFQTLMQCADDTLSGAAVPAQDGISSGYEQICLAFATLCSMKAPSALQPARCAVQGTAGCPVQINLVDCSAAGGPPDCPDKKNSSAAVYAVKLAKFKEDTPKYLAAPISNLKFGCPKGEISDKQYSLATTNIGGAGITIADNRCGSDGSHQFSEAAPFCSYKVCNSVPACDCVPTCSADAAKTYTCTYATASGGSCTCTADKNVLCKSFTSTATVSQELVCSSTTPTLKECGVGADCYNMQLQNKTYLANFSNTVVKGYDRVINGAAMTGLLNCKPLMDIIWIIEVNVCGRMLIALDSLLWALEWLCLLVALQVWLLVAVYKRWNFSYSNAAVEQLIDEELSKKDMSEKQEALKLFSESDGKSSRGGAVRFESPREGTTNVMRERIHAPRRLEPMR